MQNEMFGPGRLQKPLGEDKNCEDAEASAFQALPVLRKITQCALSIFSFPSTDAQTSVALSFLGFGHPVLSPCAVTNMLIP